jgi:hypothetical protein
MRGLSQRQGLTDYPHYYYKGATPSDVGNILRAIGQGLFFEMTTSGLVVAFLQLLAINDHSPTLTAAASHGSSDLFHWIEAVL